MNNKLHNSVVVLSERHRSLLASALYGFAKEARAMANAAAQDKQGTKFKTGAAEHFLRDAKDAEELRYTVWDNPSLCLRTTPCWRPIDANAMDGNYYMLRGPSGYIGTPHRVVVAKYDPMFRPHQPWVTYSGESVLDDGKMPTEYMELIP